jgi:hypothetical protein
VKARKWILPCSLVLNAMLLLALALGYEYFREQRLNWVIEVPHWAVYAGTMQCISDHDHGIRRYYRLTAITDGTGKIQYTGDRKEGLKVWSWPFYPIVGEPSRFATQQFVDAYNRRMRNFVLEDATTQSAQ